MAEYGMVTPALVEQFLQIAPGRVTAGADVNPDYARDEMPIYGIHMPDVAVEVRSTEEVSRIITLCAAHKVPVTARGAGTGLVGGATPIAGGVVLSTTKMNHILEYDEDNFTVRVEPGVLLNQLADDAATRGLLYPPDPGEKFATLGGNVATNAGGMRAVKYGATRDYVRAMTVVLPSGEVVHLGSNVSKTSSGYSLLNLMIGSEGTLGVITELTLKLIPLPQAAVSLVVPFVDLDACIAAVPGFMKAQLRPQALEFFEREILVSSEEYLGKAVFPRVFQGTEVGAYLLATFDGQTAEELDPVIEKAAELVLEAGALDVLVADTPAKMRDAWAARSSFLEGIEEQTKLLDECDVVVPVTRVAEFVRYFKSLAPDFDFAMKSFGHAGDGNLHIYLCSNDMEAEEFRRQAGDFMTRIYAKATEFGGLISGEHGIGMGKVEYLARSVGETNMRLMEGIKRAFDPDLILNPGKVCCTL